MTLRRALSVAGAGVLVFALGFAIGSTRSNETGLVNTIAAVLGTAGAVIALVGVALTAVALIRRA